MAAPQVSIVIPTKDRLGLLRRAVASARGQADVDVEIIVVDDGSSDGTAEAMELLAGERLTVMRRSGRRAGVARARNAGIEQARADWIAFLDDDDLLAPDRMARHLAATSAGQATVGYCARLLVDDALSPTGVRLAEQPEDVPELLRWGNVVGGPSAVVVRRDALDRAGGFDEAYSALADWKLWLQLARSETFSASPELLVAYMEHPGNMHVKDPRSVKEEYDRLCGEGWGLERSAFFGWLGQELLAAGKRRPAAACYLTQARQGRRLANAALAAGVLTGALDAFAEGDSRPTVRPRWLAELALEGGR